MVIIADELEWLQACYTQKKSLWTFGTEESHIVIVPVSKLCEKYFVSTIVTFSCPKKKIPIFTVFLAPKGPKWPERDSAQCTVWQLCHNGPAHANRYKCNLM